MKSDIRLPRGLIIFTASTLPLAPALAYGPEAASATHGLWAMVDSGFNAGAKGFTPSSPYSSVG
jgi:hypothetical protein